MASILPQDTQPNTEGTVLAEATPSAATESADTAVTGPTLFLISTAVILIAFSLLRLVPLYRKAST